MGGINTSFGCGEGQRNRRIGRRAFTLVELLVVMGIIGMLMGLIMPSMSAARATARDVQCKSNLRQIGIILQLYANDNLGWLYPVGAPGSTTNGLPTTLGTNVPPHDRWPMHVSAFDLEMPNPLPYNPAQYTSVQDAYDNVKFPCEPFTPKVMLCPSDPDALAAHSYLLNKHLADKRIRITSRDFGGLGTGEVVVMGEKVTGSVDYYMENTDFERGIVEKYRHGVRLGSNYLFMDGHVDILLPRDVIGGVDPWEPPIKDVTSQPVTK